MIEGSTGTVNTGMITTFTIGATVACTVAIAATAVWADAVDVDEAVEAVLFDAVVVAVETCDAAAVTAAAVWPEPVATWFVIAVTVPVLTLATAVTAATMFAACVGCAFATACATALAWPAD